VPDRRLLAAIALAALAILGSPGVAGRRALAHAELLTSAPGAGEVLGEAPGELRLVFSEPLEPAFSSVDLLASDGSAVLTAAGEVDAADPNALAVPLPPLAEDVYTVRWRNLSAADGHTSEGFFNFGVGDVDPGTSGGSTTTTADIDLGRAVPAWGFYIGTMGALGIAAFDRLVLRSDPRRGRRGTLSRLLAGLLGLAALATLGSIAAGWLASGSSLPEYVIGSRTGQLQAMRVAIAAAGAMAVALLPRPTLSATVTSLAAIVALVVGGHASASGAAAVAAQVVHVASASVWAGGVAGLVLLTWRPGWFGAPERPAVVVPRFSALALAAIGLVTATGLYADWIHSGGLVSTEGTWNVTLLVKAGLAVGALSIGAINYFDGGRGAGPLGGLRPRIRVELALALGVIAATGVLANAPPAGMSGVGLEPVPSIGGETVPGLGLELVPGRPGINRAVVAAQGALGDVPVELVLDRVDVAGQTRVSLSWLPTGTVGSGEHAGHATAGGDVSRYDHYAADAIVLPAGSAWSGTVRILTDDGNEVARQRFAFALDDAKVVEGQLAPIVDVSLVLAGLLGLAGALGIGLGLGGARLPRCEATASRLALVGGGAVGALVGIAIGAARLTGTG
jgi:copper transport protein